MNEIVRTIQNHRSIRSFTEQAVDELMIDEIIKSAQAMPNSINGQQVSVIVIKDKQKLAQIAELAGGQPWVAYASVMLIFVMDYYKTHLAAQKNGIEQVIHESVEGTLVGAFDGGLAMGGAIIAAESMGLGIVPIGGIRKSPKEIIALLELPQMTYPLAGLAIGHPTDASYQKPRLPVSTFRHDETYKKEHLLSEINAYDDKMTAYYASINRPQSGNWSQNTSKVYKSVYFPKVYPTMKDQSFKNDK